MSKLPRSLSLNPNHLNLEVRGNICSFWQKNRLLSLTLWLWSTRGRLWMCLAVFRVKSQFILLNTILHNQRLILLFWHDQSRLRQKWCCTHDRILGGRSRSFLKVPQVVKRPPKKCLTSNYVLIKAVRRNVSKIQLYSSSQNGFIFRTEDD